MSNDPKAVKERIEKQLLIAMNALDEANEMMQKLNTKQDDLAVSKTRQIKAEIKKVLNSRYDYLART